MTADRVDDQGDHGRIAAVRFKVRALSHRSGDDRGGCRTEDGLENNVRPQRHILRDDAVRLRIAPENHRIQFSDDRSGSVEHQSESDQPEARGSDAEIHHVLHQNIAGVFRPGQARLAERKARLHEVNQCRAE